MSTVDVIDDLVGITPGSLLDQVRAGRPQARENAQASYLALFAPADPAGLSLQDRFAIGAYVAGLHRCSSIQAHYASALALHAGTDLVDAIATETAEGLTDGPYGAYPAGPLSVEDRKGVDHRIAPAHRSVLGERLSAALDHAHLLVFHPRDASPAALQRLLDAGLATTDIVTLSQLVAFLSFQIRVIEGLARLAEVGPAVAGEAR